MPNMDNVPREYLIRLAHFEHEAVKAMNDGDRYTHEFYGRCYHKMAERIKREYGVELRPAA